MKCAAEGWSSYKTSGFAAKIDDKPVFLDYPPLDNKLQTYSSIFKVNTTSVKVSIQGLGIPDDKGSTCDNVKFFKV